MSLPLTVRICDDAELVLGVECYIGDIAMAVDVHSERMFCHPPTVQFQVGIEISVCLFKSLCAMVLLQCMFFDEDYMLSLVIRALSMLSRNYQDTICSTIECKRVAF